MRSAALTLALAMGLTACGGATVALAVSGDAGGPDVDVVDDSSLDAAHVDSADASDARDARDAYVPHLVGCPRVDGGSLFECVDDCRPCEIVEKGTSFYCCRLQ